ncbi:hypothetical protein V6N11_022319 [Hibiscus sabdariffa]|uniref:Uncharacterized protein n=1 Tax=Hibiscus sabdariffa TaxID=183260 RepID=A0ABR2TIU2_9ROSI
MSDQLGERFGNMLGSYIELDVREGDGRWVIFYRFEFLSTLVGHCGNALTLVELWMGNRGSRGKTSSEGHKVETSEAEDMAGEASTIEDDRSTRAAA